MGARRTVVSMTSTSDSARSSSALETLQHEAVELTRSLLRIDSVNTGIAETIGDGETRAARFVQEQLAEVGIESELIEPRAGRGSVVARLRGSDPSAGALVVHAHLDVVPVDGQDWTHPPFGGEVHDGWLYGRGAVDMKNFAGTILAVARHFARHDIVPRRDLIFAFLADEEAGGVWGASWLVDNRPELFAGATEALSEVGGFSFPLVRTPALQAFLDRFGAARGLPFSDDSLERDLSQLGFVSSLIGASLRKTATPTVLSAGSKTNIIPGEATARLDIRVLPGQDEALKEGLREVVGDDIDIHWGRWWSATEAAVDAPLLTVLQSAITEQDPEGLVVPYLLPASTDNKHFARLGIAGYGFVPLRVPEGFDVFGQFHSADERIPVESLEFSVRVTERILRET